MPEFVEAEAFRRTAEPLVGARIATVDVLDLRLLRRTQAEHLAIEGATVIAARRLGKLVLLDLDQPSTLALGFGLRGRLLLDRELATSADDRRRPTVPVADHVRLRLMAEGRVLELEDQLRLAVAEMDLDESRLGTDVMSLEESMLDRLIRSSGAAVKSRLMDQRVIAGIGNLLADEMLFQAGLDPRRPGSGLDASELTDLWGGITSARRIALECGGSHHGEFIRSGSRRRGARCPRCDTEIERIRVGGRTTFLCPTHQVAG